jgi:hypothetical protein
VRPGLPAVVTVTRERHPLAGRELRVLGWMRRHGRLELLLELPDGSKRLIPAEWTSQHAGRDAGTGQAGTLGTTADLLAASALISAFSACAGTGEEQAARKTACPGG